jgi:hypothetical protein
VRQSIPLASPLMRLVLSAMGASWKPSDESSGGLGKVGLPLLFLSEKVSRTFNLFNS